MTLYLRDLPHSLHLNLYVSRFPLFHSQPNQKYYCEECILGVRLVPKLIRRIDDVQEEVDVLISHVKSLQTAVLNSPYSNVPPDRKSTIPQEDIMIEL